MPVWVLHQFHEVPECFLCFIRCIFRNPCDITFSIKLKILPKQWQEFTWQHNTHLPSSLSYHQDRKKNRQSFLTACPASLLCFMKKRYSRCFDSILAIFRIIFKCYTHDISPPFLHSLFLLFNTIQMLFPQSSLLLCELFWMYNDHQQTALLLRNY